jgi:HEPN domain-containing protein
LGSKEVGEVEEIPRWLRCRQRLRLNLGKSRCPRAAVEESCPEEPVAAVTAESLGEAVIESEQAERR